MEDKRSADLPTPVANKQKKTTADIGQAVRDMDAPEEVMTRSDAPVGSGDETSDRRIFTEIPNVMQVREAGAILMATKLTYVTEYDRINVYDMATRQQINEIATGGGRVRHISQSRDGKCLFVACDDGTVKIINLSAGNEVILHGHTGVVRCVIQGEGIDVLACSYDGTIRRWNSLTGECLMIYEGHVDVVASILYDEATKRIFSASYDMTIIVWNGETGEKIGVMEGHRDWVRSLTKATSTTIASGSNDGTIKLWDMAILVCIKTISNGSKVYSVAATSDGQYVISGSHDKEVKVWSVANGQCLHTLAHHCDWVHKVAISPDGRFVAWHGYYDMVHLHSVSPPFAFEIHKGVLVHRDREGSFSLFSDGAIRNSNGDLITTITDTTTCSRVSETQVHVYGHAFAAPSVSSACLWSEAFGAVAADLALHPDDRASSADQMIRRYRFNLLQAILVHRRERGTRKWHIPREIVQIVAGYLFRGH
jgi:WD40 repeat protein